ncbi:hypothetical protein KM043_006210 [Ampulex compressa]|nr:hypothetical protein KM043_006210 [Ampulex compressa]
MSYVLDARWIYVLTKGPKEWSKLPEVPARGFRRYLAEIFHVNFSTANICFSVSKCKNHSQPALDANGAKVSKRKS